METKHRKVESVEERTIPSRRDLWGNALSRDRQRKKQRHTYSRNTLKNMSVNLIEKNVRFLTHGQMIPGKQRERERDVQEDKTDLYSVIYIIYLYVYINVFIYIYMCVRVRVYIYISSVIVVCVCGRERASDRERVKNGTRLEGLGCGGRVETRDRAR